MKEWDLGRVDWGRKEVTSVGIESGAMEGDRPLVGGRRLSERGAGASNLAGERGTQAGQGASRGAGALRWTFSGFTLPKIEESWANEGDRRLVEGRREEERDCQTRGRAQWGDPRGPVWDFSQVVDTRSTSKNRGILGYGG